MTLTEPPALSYYCLQILWDIMKVMASWKPIV